MPETSKLNILFLSNRMPYPVSDGQSRRTYNILKGMCRSHNVYFLSLCEEGESIDLGDMHHLETFCAYVELIPATPRPKSAKMLSRTLLSLFTLIPYTVSKHYSGVFIKRILELLQTKDFHLVHCDILPIAYVLKKIKQHPCVLTDHDVSYLKALRIAEQCKNPLLQGIYFLDAYKIKRMESSIFRWVEAGITVSDIDKDILKKLCPKARFEIVENGVSTKLFKDKATQEKNTNTMLWLGGFKHYPNTEAMLYFLDRIYPLIKKQTSKIHLVIIGEHPPKRIKEYALNDTSITITGYVDDPVPHIQQATLFIAPILSGSGTRLKILEAMAAEKPIVTTTIGCEGIDGSHMKHFLIADTPGDFADCAVTLLKDEKLRVKLSKQARELAVKKYDWSIIIKNMDSLYVDLANSSSKRTKKCLPLSPRNIAYGER